MKCSYCGGAVSWVGNLIDNPSTQCADCGRRNCQEVEPIGDDYDEGEPEGASGVSVVDPRFAAAHYQDGRDLLPHGVEGREGGLCNCRDRCTGACCPKPTTQGCEACETLGCTGACGVGEVPRGVIASATNQPKEPK